MHWSSYVNVRRAYIMHTRIKKSYASRATAAASRLFLSTAYVYVENDEKEKGERARTGVREGRPKDTKEKSGRYCCWRGAAARRSGLAAREVTHRCGSRRSRRRRQRRRRRRHESQHHHYQEK
ncbi:unnamed protein product [Trichogramma brassicae]|uniref:Uncharacterized protein n=1 Tax=Trichogramma brassicae TaxID=86971 RepID=A0A6H5IDH2_9HYME|nr:unnamed protein product [Trichogramma brassicae]